MKDQFANYVVQKVLETCDDQQRELILTRIKVHLTALKKYTYGKHVVARIEKLVAAGGMYMFLFSSMSTLHLLHLFEKERQNKHFYDISLSLSGSFLICREENGFAVPNPAPDGLRP